MPCELDPETCLPLLSPSERSFRCDHEMRSVCSCLPTHANELKPHRILGKYPGLPAVGHADMSCLRDIVRRVRVLIDLGGEQRVGLTRSGLRCPHATTYPRKLGLASGYRSRVTS